jgi:hypothetical protein
MPEYAGKENAAQDLQGNWWYQDPKTAFWYIWNGQDWLKMPGAAPRIAPHPSKPVSERRLPWSCLLTALSVSLIALIVLGGITIVAYQFIPGYHINPGQGDQVQIIKSGGIGIFGIILGLLMIYAGFGKLFSKGRTPKNGTKTQGCGTVMNGIGQLLFGLLFFSAGLGLIAVTFYQEVLPWLGL